MTDETKNIPGNENIDEANSAEPSDNGDAPEENNDLNDRLERLGGEPAPVITPEEFARLQRAGQVHIDSGGRVRTARRRDEDDGGVSLRKRRAWYTSGKTATRI